MTEMLEVLRSGVQPAECDRMGHFNVRQYFQKAMDGMAALGAAVGLPPRLLAERGQGLIAREQHVRYLRELRPGDVYAVRAGVLEASAEQLRVYSQLEHLTRGEPAAGVTTTLYLGELASRAAVALPQDVLERCRQLSCELPAHGAPRGVSNEPAGPAPSLHSTAQMHPAFLGPVPAAWCDAAGFLLPAGHIACVSDGIGHYFRRSQRPRAGGGGAALEYRFVYRTPARADDIIAVYTALVGVAPKTTRLCHYLFDHASGACVATSEAVTVVFDLEARRVVALSDDERAFLQGQVVEGLGI